MDVLITAATAREIQPVIDFISIRDPASTTHNLEVLVTGVGAVATTYTLTRRIHTKRPHIIIQSGIAGSFAPMPPDIPVVIKEDMLADMGVWEQDVFKTIFDLGLAPANEAPFSNGMLVNPHEKLLALSPLEQVRAMSVNEISTSAERINWHQQKHAPLVESMEGAAFHFVCLQEHIPFLQIRSVSNLIGERDKTKWHIKAAVAALNEQLIALLQILNSYHETDFRI